MRVRLKLKPGQKGAVIGYDEIDLRQKVKDAGGTWSKSTKTWKIPYKIARKPGLKKRTVGKESKAEER